MKARFFAIAAMVLGLASCAKDFAPDANVAGGEVDYRLSVSAPELAMTRAAENGTNDNQNALDSAFGGVDYFQGTDWTTVDLRYTLEVYDADKDGNATSETPVKDRMVKVFDKYEQASFDLRLIQNRNYRFVVFADFVKNGAATAWTEAEKLTEDGLNHSFPKTLKEITLINEDINEESADAYFAGKLIVPTNASKNEDTIELTRPYAKVRVVATDLAELNNNSTPAKVTVEYSDFNANLFNAVTGKFDGKYETKSFTRSYTDPEASAYTAGYDAYTEKFVTVKGEETRFTHKTLFTDYIPASDEQKTIQFQMSVYDEQQIIKTTNFNTDIPVQRNFLTTIIGNVLTTETEINVTIDDNFRGYYNPAIVFVGTAEQLQEAINNYKNGQTILFSDDIKGNVLINQKEGVHYLIDGGNHKYDGIIEINGDARQADPDSVTLQNINFETTKTGIDVIDANKNEAYGNKYNYAHNITIKGCKFNLGEESVAMKFRQSKNVRVVNCEMAAGHSFMQLYGCNGVAVEYVDVVAKNGISFGTSFDCVVKQSVFNNIGYGFRGEPGGEVVADGIEITASKPVIVRKLTKGNYNLTINGSKLNAPGYHVIFTNGSDDATFVAPKGTFKFDTDGDFFVFPGEKLFAYNAAELQTLLDNAVPGETVIGFAADIVGDITVDQAEGENIVLDGRDYKFNGTIFVNGHARMHEAETLLIKNINFETADAARAFVEQNSTASDLRYPHNVTIDNCTFKGAGEDVMVAKIRQGKNIVVKNSVVEVGHSLMQLYGTENVTVDNVTVKAGRGISFGTSTNNVVKNSTFDVTSYGLRTDATLEAVLNIENVNIAANLPVVARKASANYTINFTGVNTLNAGGEYQVVFTTGDDEAAFVAPAAYTLTGADEFYCFPRDLKSAEEVNALINAGEKNIQLSGKYVGTIVLKSDVTLIGNNKTVVDCINLNGADNITIKGIEFDAAGAQVSHDGRDKEQVKANIISPKSSVKSGSIGVLIEDCTFAGTYGEGDFVSIAFTDRSRTSGVSGKITVKGCTFATSNAHYDIYAYYSGNDYLNVENNSFKSQHKNNGYDVYLGRYQSSTTVVVNGNAFDTKANIDEAVCIQLSSGTYVAPNSSDNTFAI